MTRQTAGVIAASDHVPLHATDPARNMQLCGGALEHERTPGARAGYHCAAAVGRGQFTRRIGVGLATMKEGH